MPNESSESPVRTHSGNRNVREMKTGLEKTVFMRPFGNSDHQLFGWPARRIFTVCKAYLIDDVARDNKYLEGPYLVWRSDYKAYDAERTQEYIRSWEVALGVVEPTEILTTEFKYAILVQPSKPWLYGPPGLHLHTFLIRTAIDWDGERNPLEHVYHTRAGLSPEYSDAVYAERARKTLTTCIEHRTLPFKKYRWSLYPRFRPSHFDGFVDMEGDPLEC